MPLRDIVRVLVEQHGVCVLGSTDSYSAGVQGWNLLIPHRHDALELILP